MVNILSRQQWRLQQRGFTPEQARLIAYKQQKSRGTLVGNSFKLNDVGQMYSNMSPAERAIIRRAQETNKPAYYYQFVDGRVKLKDQYKKRK